MQILNASNLTPDFEEGDVGIILKKNGEDFQLFNMHKDLDPNAMTDQQLYQGRVMLALAVVLQTPKMLDMILELSETAMKVGGDVMLTGMQH